MTALAGVALKLFAPRKLEKVSIAVYLAQGWALLPALGPVIDGLPVTPLLLLLAGGLLYTVGVGFYLSRRLPYHNALWHAFVLAAATCHYVAILQAVALPSGQS
jgi:hemolysin III